MSTAPLGDDWISEHFDPLAPELAPVLHPTLRRARETCPVARSDRYDDGFWVLTRYDDVLRTAQNWQTFSNELGITVPHRPIEMKIIPVGLDPPLHREFKRLINAHFTPSAVAPWEEPTRALVDGLIDGFIERGECEFITEFAQRLPGLSFFDFALHAPAEELEQVNELARKASMTHLPDQHDHVMALAMWIAGFVQRREQEGPRGDVVDAVLAAQIEGRPITLPEVIGTIQLLVLGGLETTAGVLGAAMIRFCEQPELPELLRARPELIPGAVEELLRMDGSFVCIGRTARHDADIAGHAIAAGERVVMYWAAANRDPAEFPDPETFDPERADNRHVAFGAGPHRCAGSNLARQNLRVAVEVLVHRLRDVRLAVPVSEVEWHSEFNRSPLAVPITFTPGPRVTTA